MSMKRRFLAAALTAALMVSMLSGCASSKKDTQSDTQQAAVTTSMEQLNSKNEPDIIDDNYRTCYEVFVHSFYDSNDILVSVAFYVGWSSGDGVFSWDGSSQSHFRSTLHK